jgi:hypothetical protein
MKKTYLFLILSLTFLAVNAQEEVTDNLRTLPAGDYNHQLSVYVPNNTEYGQGELDYAKSLESTTESKTLTILLDAASKNWLSGDVPEGCSYDFTSDYSTPTYLEANQKNTLTIKGMPTNCIITGIDVTGYCEQRKGAATIKSYINDTEIASLEYGGTRAKHGKVVGQTKTKMEMDLVSDASKVCTGDLILKAACEAQNMTVESYDIHYEISEATGVSMKNGIKITKATDGNGSLIYNLQGELVNENYKGIIIANGHKFIKR